MTAVRSLPLVTNSQLRSFRRCKLQAHYAYELGYRAANEVEALRFGTLLHLGLEAWWRTLWAEQLGMAKQTPLEAAIDALVGAADEFELVRAGVLLQGYDARWAAAAEELEVLAVEVEFRAPLINPATGAASRTFAVGGKLDAIVRSRVDGLVYIVEHKSSSEDIGAGSAYWERLQLDTQISIYFAGARILGFEPAGCIYDVIGKPRLSPLKATPIESRKFTKDGRLYANQRAADETPDEFRQRLVEAIAENPDRYYQRGTVVRLETEERDAAFDTWWTARAIRDAQLVSAWPKTPDACDLPGRRCAYFPVCTRQASLEDPGQYRRVDNVHQELSGESPAHHPALQLPAAEDGAA